LIVHLHPAAVAIVSLPFPPSRSKSSGSAVTAYAQAGGVGVVGGSREVGSGVGDVGVVGVPDPVEVG